MVAAILHGEHAARAFGGGARLRRRLRDDDPAHALHRGETLRIDARGAAGDDNFRLGPLPTQPADRLAGLARRFRRHRAGIDDDRLSRTGGLTDVIEKGRTYGMQSFDQHLSELYKAGAISMETARAAASNPADFERNLAFE